MAAVLVEMAAVDRPQAARAVARFPAAVVDSYRLQRVHYQHAGACNGGRCAGVSFYVDRLGRQAVARSQEAVVDARNGCAARLSAVKAGAP
jgi:hypothetical protein